MAKKNAKSKKPREKRQQRLTRFDLSRKQICTIINALRILQHETTEDDDEEERISDGEIDALCEELNCGGTPA